MNDKIWEKSEICLNPLCKKQLTGKRRKYCNAFCAREFEKSLESHQKQLEGREKKRGFLRSCESCQNKILGMGRTRFCETCAPSKDWHAQSMIKHYGLSKPAYDRMIIDQHNACAICKRSFEHLRISVDHDHSSGLVRGLLCYGCNTGLSLIDSDKCVIDNVVNYLSSPPRYKHWKNVNVSVNTRECRCCQRLLPKYRKMFCDVCIPYDDQQRASGRLDLYGISQETFEKIYDDQRGQCAICDKELTLQSKRGWHSTIGNKFPAVVDHCHLTKDVRGLLCTNCNAKIGHFDKMYIIPNLLNYVKGTN